MLIKIWLFKFKAPQEEALACTSEGNICPADLSDRQLQFALRSANLDASDRLPEPNKQHWKCFWRADSRDALSLTIKIKYKKKLTVNEPNQTKGQEKQNRKPVGG